MAGSPFDSLFAFFNNVQNMLSSGSSSSCPPFIPELKQLNDMVYQVYSPLPMEKPTLEIIFFHGLQQRYSDDAYFTTWLSNDGSHLWLQTWLVEAFPTARILTISYNVSLTTSQETANLDMYCTSENLVSSLIDSGVRVGQEGCPVVLVGHCLGGLVLKQVCLHAAYLLSRNSDDGFGIGRVRDLLMNLRGMFFYGTPHTGSLLGDELPKHKSALAEEIETLKASSMRRNEEFRQLKLRYNWLTYGIGEQDKTFMVCLRTHIYVVPEESARAYMDNYRSIRGDHFSISKPSTKQASGFSVLTNFLEMIQDSGLLQVIHDVESQEYYIDLEGRAAQVAKLVAQPNVHTTFITGCSGIGKSALAQRVFHNICHSFTVTCFVSVDTVDPAVDTSKCKKQLMENIQASLEGSSNTFRNHFSLLRYLKNNKVLMVLDNVQSKCQLDVVEAKTWLEGTSSKLIVTTTNLRLAETKLNDSVVARFDVPYLNDEESRQLFSKYAFENAEAPMNVNWLVDRVIEICANVPLALKIVSSYARAEDVDDPRLWIELVARMDKAVDVDSDPSYKLWATLKVCFTALGRPEQELFLDVATLFHGVAFPMVECIWAGCWEFSYTAWNNLKNRFLANVDKDGNIWMHSLLRLLGQSIACDPSTTLAKWRRVYKTKDGKALIESYQGLVDATGLRLQIEQPERLFLANRTFVPYEHLRYLLMEGVEVKGKNLELPTSLVYLSWTNGLFETCPVNFSRLKNLVALDLTNCRAMKALPAGLEHVPKLTWLELKDCVSLANPLGMLPKFPSLKHLGVRNIRALAVDEPQLTQGVKYVCSLRWLMSLDLSYTALRALPEGINNLRSLSKLNVEGTKLISLPESIGELGQLKILNLTGTCLESLPDSIGKLGELRELQLRSTEITRLPDTIGDLSNLEALNIVYTKVREIPKTFKKLLRLKSYKGRATSLDNSLQHLASLNSLKTLSLELRDIGEQGTLAGADSQSPVEISSFLSSFSSFTLSRLYIVGKGYVQSLLPQLFAALQTMPCLEELFLWEFNVVTIMPQELGTLTNLKQLFLHHWEMLEELPESLGNLSMLKKLYLNDMPRLSRLPESLVALSSLSALVILKCENLESLPTSLGHRSSLQRNNYAAPSSSEDPSQSTLLPILFYTNSWRLSECFSGCCGGSCLTFFVGCEEMKRLRSKLARLDDEEANYDVVDKKVAMDVFREMELNRQGHCNAFTCHPRWLPGSVNRYLGIIQCCGKELLYVNAEPCEVHRRVVRLRDVED